MFLNIVLFLAFLFLSWKYKQKKYEAYSLRTENVLLKYKLISAKRSILVCKEYIFNKTVASAPINYYRLLENLDAAEKQLEN